MLLDHLEVLQRIFDSFFLVRWTLRDSVSFCFGFVIAFTLDNAVLGLDLGDIQTGNFQAGMFQHIFLNSLVGGIVQET